MIEILITLLVVAVIIYIVYIIVGMINLPSPIKTIVYLVVGLIILIWLLSYFGISGGLGGGRPVGLGR